MKYVLFVLAALLLLIGGYAVYTGAAIINIERGWASVISGTTAIVGGGIILALAWAIKTLEQIRGTLRSGSAIPTLSGAAIEAALTPTHEIGADQLQLDRRNGHGAAAEPVFAPPAPFAPHAPLTAPPGSASSPAAPLSWPPHTSPLPPAAPANVPTPATEALQGETAEAEPELEHHDRAERFAAEAEEIVNAPLDERPVAEPAKPSSGFKNIWQRVGKETEPKESGLRSNGLKPAGTPPSAPKSPLMPRPLPVERTPLFAKRPLASPPVVEPPPAAPPLPPPPQHDLTDDNDWLDKALAELDSAIAETPFVRSTESAPPLPPREPPKEAADTSRSFGAPPPLFPPAPTMPLRDPAVGEPHTTEPHETEFHITAAQVEVSQGETLHETSLGAPAGAPIGAQLGDLDFGELAPVEPPYTEPSPLTAPLGGETEVSEEPSPLVQEPAVIGRYEAEGTTYVMFADGSIEAQSERGVARFASMAELKAYFETQDAPQV